MPSDLPDQYRQHVVASLDGLEALYGPANPASLVKELDHISDHYRHFIEKSPFVVIASSGPDGIDCSPRGDPPGFVRVVDSKTVLLPDRRGNNRLDTLRNLVSDPRASLLFLIPGVGETLRINGHCYIVTEPELLQSFEMQGKSPATVLVFRVERVYFQCSKALMRSKLWQSDAQIARSELPSTGEILSALSQEIDAGEYDRAYPRRLKETIY
ncbi:MAG: pyridoxamine 5'-phosphate oxidase family protein [Hyphomicrobiaceae bacterium]